MKTRPQAVIVDDESKAGGALVSLLELYCPKVEVCGIAQDISTATEMCLRYRPQVVFLDVELGTRSGFELLPLIEHLRPAIIFTTGHQEFAVEAFKVNAAHYLLKPIEPQQLQVAVAKALKSTHLKAESAELPVAKRLRIRTDNSIYLVDHYEVIVMEGSGNYTTFHLRDGRKLLASKNLGYYSSSFPETDFFRCHQSFLVQLVEVQQVELSGGCRLIMNNDQVVPVAMSKRRALLALLR